MSCSICQHPKRQEIDPALVAGSVTLAALSQKYHLSTSALQRHKAHLQAQVNQGRDRLLDNLRQGCLFWLTQALEMTMATAQAAQAQGNGKLVLKALAQGTRLTTIILKNNLPLDDRTVYELLTSPQWTTQSGFLPYDPNIMAMSRQALNGIFSTSCPEKDALSEAPFSPDDLALMQQLLQVPASLATPVPACQPQWEKSGKSPGKISGKQGNSKNNQEDALWEKISGIMASSSLAGPLPPGSNSSKLDCLLQELAEADKKTAAKPALEYIYEQSLKGGENNQAAVKGCRV